MRLFNKALAFCISLSLMVPLCLMPVQATNITNFSSLESTQYGYTKEYAISWITSELSKYSQACYDEISKGTSASPAELIRTFAIYLAYMNWVTSCMWLELNTSEAYTVFEGETEMYTIGERYVDTAEDLRNRLCNNVDLPTNIKNVLGSSLPSSVSTVREDELAAQEAYYTMFWNLIDEYCDTSIQKILANSVGSSTYADQSTAETELNRLFGTTLADEIASGNEANADFQKLLQQCRQDIMPYLQVYSLCYAKVSELSSVSLSLWNDKDTGKVFACYTNKTRLDPNSALVSPHLRAAYMYMYSDNSSVEPESSGLPDLNIASNIVASITNMKVDSETFALEFKGTDTVHNLNDFGYYLLAGGAIYEPFVSKAGCEEYIEVIKSFADKDETKEKLELLIRKAITTKKQIFFTSTGTSSNVWKNNKPSPVAGEYYEAYLSDVLVYNDNTLNVFATFNGKVDLSEVDGNTLAYVQKVSSSSDTPTEATAGQGEESLVPLEVLGVDGVSVSEHQVTPPLMVVCGNSDFWSSKGDESAIAGIGALTTVLLHNAKVNCRNNEYIQRANREALYLNGFGDIVLADDTIVLPAIANPIYYEYTEVGMKTAGDLEVEKGYYPYTQSFYNPYPVLDTSGNTLKTSTDSEKNKYFFTTSMILSETGKTLYARRIGDVGDSNKVDSAYGGKLVVASIDIESWHNSGDPDKPRSNIPLKLMEYNTGTFFDAENNSSSFVFRFAEVSSDDGKYKGVLPLQPYDAKLREDYITKASMVVMSALHYISSSTAGLSADTAMSRVSSGTFRVQDFICGTLYPASLGSHYTTTVIKNAHIDYDELMDSQYGMFTTMVAEFVNNVLDTLGHIDGVLSMKNGYENSFFMSIVSFIRQYYVIFVACIVLFAAAGFAKGDTAAFYCIFLGVCSLAAFHLYTAWLPTALPAAYNFIVNDVVEDLVWDTVIMQADDYSETYSNEVRVDTASGRLRPYTATVTLYTMTDTEMVNSAVKLGLDKSYFTQGNYLFLDEESGIFIHGNQIKLSVDSLFQRNPIRGLYYNQWEQFLDDPASTMPIDESIDGNPYVIRLTNSAVSLEAYYTPFCQIERSLLLNLNNFCNIFDLPRNAYSYGDGFYKDAFVIQTFINSGIFLEPGVDSSIEWNIDTSRDMDPIGARQEVVNKVHELMDPQSDWLYLRSIFGEPSQAMRNSLWGRSMQSMGYYNADWTYSEEQARVLSNMVNYVNDQTKIFVIKHQEALSYCSDENAIKIISLFATTAFTHYVSEFGTWLYPNYLNACDIELGDVLYAAMTTMKDKVLSAGTGTVVNTMAVEMGVIGLILVLLITLVSAVFVFIMTYLVPVLYALLGIAILYKLLNKESNMTLISGYVKVTCVTALLYIAYTFALRLITIGGYRWYGYFACLVIMVLCLNLLFSVIMAIVANPLDMANDTLARSLIQSVDKLSRGRFSRLSANIAHLRTGNGNFYGGHLPFTHQSYMRRNPVDMMRRSPLGRGSRSNYGYDNHWSNYGRNNSIENSWSNGQRSRNSTVIRNRRPQGARRLIPSSSRLNLDDSD